MPPRMEAGKTGVLDARSLVGTFRRFGSNGPACEINGVGKVTPDGSDVLLHIRVLTTDETMEYPFMQAVRDPRAD